MNAYSARSLPAISTLAVTSLLVSAPAASAHHLEKHFTVQSQPVIFVHNPIGTVTVKTWTKPEVMVVADHASNKAEVDASENGNRVDLMTHLLSELNAAPEDLKADYTITVPEEAELEIHNDSGTVSVSGVSGEITVETIGAGVQLEEVAGYLVVHTIGGAFDCLRCAGRIEATSISGNMHITESASNNVRAQTSSGSIFYDGDFRPNGTYTLKNYSGPIDVLFSASDSFDLSATSIYGKVQNEASLKPPKHSTHSTPRYAKSLFGTYNTGQAKVDLTTFSGTISIRKRSE